MTAQVPEVHYLKYRDTRPGLDVFPKNPDGTGYDGTGSVAWYLLVKLTSGSYLRRSMTKVADNPLRLQYVWAAADWSSATGAGAKDDPYTAGGLSVGPAFPLVKGVVEHQMEYEVVGPGDVRITFPNGGYDILRVFDDLGQGT